MPIFLPTYHFKRNRPLETHYFLGKVVDNNDPDKLGRVKVTVTGRLAGPVADLPWIVRHAATGFGGGTELSSMLVPDVGAELAISFENGIYAGQYVGYWMTQTTTQPLFHDDYPNTYGFRDKAGTYWKVNMTQKSMEFVHETGSKLEFNKDGDVTLTTIRDYINQIGRDLIQNVKRDVKLTVTDGGVIEDIKKGNISRKAAGTINTEATGNQVVKGAKVLIN